MDPGAKAERGRGRLKRFTALALTATLIGCVADPDLAPSTSEPQVSKPAAEQGAPLRRPEAPTQTASTPPAQLLGMSRADIIKHLGPPSFQRRDRTALLLRYREGRCILDLFLYPRGQSEAGKAVDYIEARAANGQRIETRPCIDAVLKAN